MAKHFNFEVIPLPDVPLGPHLMRYTPRPLSVLIVDDEPLIADTLAAILRTKGYAASSVYNGSDAIVSAEMAPPDILITDVMMPAMNGIDLAVTVRSLIPNCAVLLFSGHANLNPWLEDPRSAVHDFPLLSKPIHPDELLTHISRLTEPAGSVA
jgi:YesN/AraC family two-component response regulator